MTEGQLRRMLHRDNKHYKVWFPEMLQRLREHGYPEMVVFEHLDTMHYTIAVPLDYEMEIVVRDTGMTWKTRNGR